MRRAAVEGVIDYSRCDPDDPWWWHRHRMLLFEFERKLLREFQRMQHEHHVVLATGNLTPESIDRSIVSAKQALNAWWKLQLPWEADRIGDAGTKTQDEQLVQQYQELVGEPGTPHYEEIMQELEQALRPISRTEMLRQRRVRQAAAAAQYQRDEMARLGLAGDDA